jgi:hypothetical protein
MHRNAFCTKAFTIQGHLNDIWIIAPARITQGGNLIDIYTKSRHSQKKAGNTGLSI